MLTFFYLTRAIISVVGDVLVDSEASVVISSILKSADFIGGAHRGRIVYIYSYIHRRWLCMRMCEHLPLFKTISSQNKWNSNKTNKNKWNSKTNKMAGLWAQGRHAHGIWSCPPGRSGRGTGVRGQGQIKELVTTSGFISGTNTYCNRKPNNWTTRPCRQPKTPFRIVNLIWFVLDHQATASN